jgi:large-conductance mechanosensitive channel
MELKKMKFIDEFKAFAIRGNVLRYGHGIIIGAAFW